VAKCCGLRVAVCGLQSQVAVVVATCDSGRRLLSENKRKGAKSVCALLFHVVYCSERTIDMRENNRIRQILVRQRSTSIARG
jgi:hypothetical protein